MKRDIVASVFLFFLLCALIFVFFFPIYFTFDRVNYRSVSVIERILSVFFVLLWFLLCVYAALSKDIACVLGGVLYSALAYLPGFVIPRLSEGTLGHDPSLFDSILGTFMRRLYELINAPMVGISVLFPPEKAVGISKWMLPLLVVFYVVTQIFRFYRNAYLADQLLLTEPIKRAPRIKAIQAARDIAADTADAPEIESDIAAETADVPEGEAEEAAETADVPEREAEEAAETADVPEMAPEEAAETADVTEMAPDIAADKADVTEDTAGARSDKKRKPSKPRAPKEPVENISRETVHDPIRDDQSLL